MLYKASKDGILEKKELERWCNKNYKTILGWFDKVLNEEREKLPKNSFLYVTTEGIFFKKKKIHFSDSLLEEAIKISGLKRYLNYYTLIYEREAVEVALFEEYLIFAQLVGIAKKVAKEFEDLYPEVIEASSFKSYNNIMFIDTVIKESVRIVEKRKIGSTTRNYSSGGGGFSSSNGGGGSFGGGSRGGGGFR